MGNTMGTPEWATVAGVWVLIAASIVRAARFGARIIWEEECDLSGRKGEARCFVSSTTGVVNLGGSPESGGAEKQKGGGRDFTPSTTAHAHRVGPAGFEPTTS